MWVTLESVNMALEGGVAKLWLNFMLGVVKNVAFSVG